MWFFFPGGKIRASGAAFVCEVACRRRANGFQGAGCRAAGRSGCRRHTCYWIGTLGKTEWITRLGVSTRQLARARKFLSGRGALMAFFAFLPTIGEAIAIVLGLMRSNVWLTGGAMLAGKTLRYIVVLATFRGALSLF